jgi:hypothetical protein
MGTVFDHLARIAGALKNRQDPDLGCGALVQAAGSEIDNFATIDSPWQTAVLAEVDGADDDEAAAAHERMVWEYANEVTETDFTQARALLELVSQDSMVHLLRKSEANAGGRIFIGRARRNDVTIKNNTVSSIHLQLEPMEDDRAMIIDCRSSNGSYRNGERLAPNRQEVIQSGDSIRLGKCKYFFLGQNALRVFLKLLLAEALTQREATIRTVAPDKTTPG